MRHYHILEQLNNLKDMVDKIIPILNECNVIEIHSKTRKGELKEIADEYYDTLLFTFELTPDELIVKYPNEISNDVYIIDLIHLGITLQTSRKYNPRSPNHTLKYDIDDPIETFETWDELYTTITKILTDIIDYFETKKVQSIYCESMFEAKKCIYNCLYKPR